MRIILFEKMIGSWKNDIIWIEWGSGIRDGVACDQSPPCVLQKRSGEENLIAPTCPTHPIPLHQNYGSADTGRKKRHSGQGRRGVVERLVRGGLKRRCVSVNYQLFPILFIHKRPTSNIIAICMDLQIDASLLKNPFTPFQKPLWFFHEITIFVKIWILAIKPAPSNNFVRYKASRIFDDGRF